MNRSMQAASWKLVDNAIADEHFELSDVEVETLRRAATERRLPFDPERRHYSKDELRAFGLVRESYTKLELESLGFSAGPVASCDAAARKAEELLKVDTPFGTGIRKWQLPIVARLLRVEQTEFPPNSIVTPHVHPINSASDTGGGLRIIVKGKVFHNGRVYNVGDWFFAPNGTPYSFTTDAEGPTVVMYIYRFFGDEYENRFSHPTATRGSIQKARASMRVLPCELGIEGK